MLKRKRSVIRAYSIPKAIDKLFNDICDKNDYNKSAIVTALMEVFIENEIPKEYKHSGEILEN